MSTTILLIGSVFFWPRWFPDQCAHFRVRSDDEEELIKVLEEHTKTHHKEPHTEDEVEREQPGKESLEFFEDK